MTDKQFFDLTKENQQESLTDAELAEYMALHNCCGSVLLYPSLYRYSHQEDSYTEKDDKHEWHPGADVRRLRELAARVDPAQIQEWVARVSIGRHTWRPGGAA